VRAFLTEHPWSSTTDVTSRVQGNAARLREELKTGLYDSVKGPRGATRWANLDPVLGSEDGQDGVE